MQINLTKGNIFSISICLILVFMVFMYFYVNNQNKYSETNFTQEYLTNRINAYNIEKDSSESRKKILQSYVETLKKIDECLKTVKYDSIEVNKVIENSKVEIKLPLSIDSIKTEQIYSIEENLNNSLYSQIKTCISSNGITITNNYGNSFFNTDDYDLNQRINDIYYNSIRPINLNYISDWNAVKSYCDNNKFIQDLKNITNQLGNLGKEFQNKINSDSLKNLAINKNVEDVQKELNELRDQSVIKVIILFVLPLFAVILILLYIFPLFFADDKIRGSLYENGILIQIITIFLLVGTVMLLGLAKIIPGDVVGTLLGSISVYVLQKTNTDKSNIDINKLKAAIDKFTESANTLSGSNKELTEAKIKETEQNEKIKILKEKIELINENASAEELKIKEELKTELQKAQEELDNVKKQIQELVNQ